MIEVIKPKVDFAPLKGWLNERITRDDDNATAYQSVLDFLDREGSSSGYNGSWTTYAGQSAIVIIHPDDSPDCVWNDGGPIDHFLNDGPELLGDLPTVPGCYQWSGSVSFSKSWTDCGWEYECNANGQFIPLCLFNADCFKNQQTK